MDTLLVAKAIAVLLLPPGGNLVMALVGLMLLPRRRLLGSILLMISFVTLFGFSLPKVSTYLIASLDDYPALSNEAMGRKDVRAIVILGGGRRPNAPEYGGDTLSGYSLARVRYAAHLHRKTGLPLLLTGGVVFGEGIPEAVLMKDVLEKEFQVPVAWLEKKSRNTQENANFTQKILSREGIDTFFLISHSSHLPRAVEAFQRVGLDPIPAPTGLTTTSENTPEIFKWLPNAGSLQGSYMALYEYLGRIWYRMRY